MRLAKYLAHAGVESRRAAERLIAEGRVTIDGTVVRDPATGVGSGEDPPVLGAAGGASARIEVDGVAVTGAEPRVVYALHKPLGVVCTVRDPQGRTTVVELLPDERRRLYPVGRLDVDTSGLLLLTNDGALAHRLTHPRFGVEKAYHAWVAGTVEESALRRLAAGVELDDGPTAPALVCRLGPRRLEIVITEGRKRQVRRMCEAVGHPVERLVRVRFGPLALGGLPAGEHRRLGARELRELHRLVAASARSSPRTPSRPARAGTGRSAGGVRGARSRS